MVQWDKYQMILIDMDGTLYYQRSLQMVMAIKMIKNTITHKDGWKELKVILQFRRLREKWAEDNVNDEKIIDVLAEGLRFECKEIKKIIERWIYKEPLSYMEQFRDEELIEWIKNRRKQGVKVVIYSDYPTEEKQQILNIEEFPGFCGCQQEIGRMKPDPKGINVIAKMLGEEQKDRILMIGDRDSKDGEAARAAAVDYLILKKYKIMRKRQYKKLLK